MSEQNCSTANEPSLTERAPDKPRFLLFVLFIISSAVRAYLAQNVQSFRFINDEMLYWNMAHSLWQQQRLLYHGVPTTFVNLLYPLFLAPLAAIGDVASAFAQSKVLGAVLISSAVFPAYLIARRILKDRARPLAVALLALLLPEMIFSALMLTEVVFYPLSLWFIYLVVRYLDLQEHRAKLSFLSFMACFALLLFLCKTSSIFLPLSFGLLLIAESWLDEDFKWQGLQRITAYGGLFVLVYLVYNLAFVLLNRLTALTATELGTLVQYISLAEHIPYIIVTTLLYMLIFSVAALVFPVLLPLIHLQDYPRQEQKLVLYALICLIVGSLIIVLTVTLKEDFPDPLPRMHLRYLFPLLFVWLPLALDALKRFSLRGKERALCAGVAAITLPYFYLVTSCHSLIEYDAPSRALLRWCKDSSLGMSVAYAALRLAVVIATIILARAMYLARSRRAVQTALLSLLAAASLVNATLLQKLVAPKPTEYQTSLIREATAIGNYLRQNEGEILLLSREPRGDAMLEPYLPRAYYLLWEGERELHDYLWHEGSRVALANDPIPVHVLYSAYNQRPHVAAIRYLLISGNSYQTLFLEESLRLVELDCNTYKLYEVVEPGYLAPYKTLSGPLNKEDTYVLEHRLRHRAEQNEMLLELDIELQEALPPGGATLVLQHGKQEIRVSLHSKRYHIVETLNLPAEQSYFDLGISAYDSSETALNHRVIGYALRAVEPKH